MIMLDTHVLLWLTSEPEKLSSDAVAAIKDARKEKEGLAICDITLLELTTAINRGRVRLSISLETLLQEFESKFVVLPITSRACARVAQLPATYPKDPADRIIGATALVEGLPLITADRAIWRSKALHTIW